MTVIAGETEQVKQAMSKFEAEGNNDLLQVTLSILGYQLGK